MDISRRKQRNFMKNTIDIPYKLIRERRKTLAIHIMPDTSVIVKSPHKTTDEEIRDFFCRKRRWIEKQIAFFKECRRINGEIISGAEYFFLGKQYQLIIKKAELREYVDLAHCKLIVHNFFPKKIERSADIFHKWLKEETEKQFLVLLEKCLQKFPEMPMPNLKIRFLRRRWGSFNANNKITLNADLIAVEKQCIEYVITHELCYHMNHSSAFYRLLESKIPDWKVLKIKLEKSPIIRL